MKRRGSRKHLLITNDDGVTAPGLLVLAREISSLGDVSILAPDRNWSGKGHVKTINNPLRVREVILENGVAAFASDGAPSDWAALAMLGYFPEPIDLVVSGINPMPNLGHEVTYSGTVTAAMEAVIRRSAGFGILAWINCQSFGPAGLPPRCQDFETDNCYGN